MYPEEGKKIGYVRSRDDKNNCEFYYSTKPHPPPRHKPDAGKMSNFNLIEL